MKLEFTPKLYILVRTDMASMNPGRVAAQASHAPLPLIEDLIKTKNNFSNSFKRDYESWSSQTSQGFGTTIVLDLDTIETIQRIINTAPNKWANVYSGMVHDPEYAIQDGNVTHLIPIDTCGYILCNNPLFNDLENFPLYNGIPYSQRSFTKEETKC